MNVVHSSVSLAGCCNTGWHLWQLVQQCIGTSAVERDGFSVGCRGFSYQKNWDAVLLVCVCAPAVCCLDAPLAIRNAQDLSDMLTRSSYTWFLYIFCILRGSLCMCLSRYLSLSLTTFLSHFPVVSHSLSLPPPPLLSLYPFYGFFECWTACVILDCRRCLTSGLRGCRTSSISEESSPRRLQR